MSANIILGEKLGLCLEKTADNGRVNCDAKAKDDLNKCDELWEDFMNKQRGNTPKRTRVDDQQTKQQQISGDDDKINKVMERVEALHRKLEIAVAVMLDVQKEFREFLNPTSDVLNECINLPMDPSQEWTIILLCHV